MGLLAYFALGLLIAGPSINGVEYSCCRSGWLSLQGNCYKLFTDKLSWNGAVSACQKLFRGSRLASIHSSWESVELAKYVSRQLLGRSNVWIGLYDPCKNQQWRWVDKTPFNYRAWNPGEPNNQGNEEYCVELWASSGYTKWNDLKCTNARPYLCKYKP